jgi:hypothetical protein
MVIALTKARILIFCDHTLSNVVIVCDRIAPIVP